MAQPLTDAITALTTYANEVTGQSDTTLSDAVRTLCDGYGGGGGNLEIGSFTLDSNFALTAAGNQVIPNLNMGFQPDLLLWVISRESFESITPSGHHLWGMIAIKDSLLPYMNPAIEKDYLLYLYQVLTQDADSPNGYRFDRPSNVGTTYYPRFSINADGTVSVGRFSSASSTMYAGTYDYYAIKL